MPWLVFGDFNKIMYSFEKQGSLVYSDCQKHAFRSVLEDFSLEDLGYNGVWFI